MLEPWHYIALLGAVVAVGALSMPRTRNKTSNPPVQSVQNMETALEQFMENMEKDNDELLQLVAKSQADAMQEGERKDKRIAALEQRCETLDAQLQQTLDKLAQTTTSAAVAAEAAEAKNEPQQEKLPISSTSSGEDQPGEAGRRPHSIVARYAELFHMYQEGKSIEAIAKKMGMNKGEVQLIIGLAKQEGAAHV